MVMFLIPFFAVGLGTFGWGVWQAYQGLDSLAWTQVEGRVQSSEVKSSRDSDGTTYRSKITYTYEWGNEKKSGDQVRTSGSIGTSGGGLARDEVARYPAGKPVKVFVNPKQPKTAVLEPGLGWSHLFLPLFGMIFAGVASLFLWFALRGARQQKAKEAQAAAQRAAGVIDFGGEDATPGPEGLAWSALDNTGSASFRSSKLKLLPNGNLQVVPTLGMWLFALLFGGLGLGLLIGFTCSLATEEHKEWGKLVPILVGGAFFAAGLLMFYFLRQGAVFDVMAQRCSRLKIGKLKGQEVSFAKVEGLQVLQFEAKSDDSTYTNYQLNLVLKDCTRANLMTHGNQAAMEADADTLAQVLRVPVWKKGT